MTEWDTEELIAADKKFVWHLFTKTHDWCAPEHEPLVLVEGYGAILRDSRGREYIDGNSSIWTNIHGHNHPHINAVICQQLDRIAHTFVLMPPLCITPSQLSSAIKAIRNSMVDVCGQPKMKS